MDPEIESLGSYWETIIHSCNFGREQKKFFLPFKLEGKILGYLHPRMQEQLKRWPNVFFFDPGDLTTGVGNGWVTLHPTVISTGERTKQVDEVLRILEVEKFITDWRNELIPIVSQFDGHHYFSLERAAIPYFGTKAYGLHVNGYVRKGGKDFLWLSKRSKKKKSFAGAFDNIVTAGQPAGMSCKQNMIQKCKQKANIPPWLAERLLIPSDLLQDLVLLREGPRAVSVGDVSYEQIAGLKMKRDVIYCYDLELPSDFLPFSNDGDVENFHLVSLPEVAKMICTSKCYKLNSSLVVIDFLFRHGYILLPTLSTLYCIGFMKWHFFLSFLLAMWESFMGNQPQVTLFLPFSFQLILNFSSVTPCCQVSLTHDVHHHRGYR